MLQKILIIEDNPDDKEIPPGRARNSPSFVNFL
jgi:hypothetical protein